MCIECQICTPNFCGGCQMPSDSVRANVNKISDH